MKKSIRPQIRQDWSSVVDGGMQLEISATVDGLGHQLLTILADEKDESLWVKVFAGDTPVQIPFALVLEALQAAVGEVHSETWHDKNLPPGRDA